MSRLVARILLSMFMFPLAVMLYFLVVAIGETSGRTMGYSGYQDREKMIALAAGTVTWAGVALYWCLLWRTGIRWTGVRVGGTLAAAAAAVAVGGGVALVIVSALGGRGEPVAVLFLGGPLSILLWLFATIFLWRETKGERAARVGAAGGSTVTYPTCGYNLTGLHDTRCPECGSRFTLNELLASQPARASAGELD